MYVSGLKIENTKTYSTPKIKVTNKFSWVLTDEFLEKKTMGVSCLE